MTLHKQYFLEINSNKILKRGLKEYVDLTETLSTAKLTNTEATLIDVRRWSLSRLLRTILQIRN